MKKRVVYIFAALCLGWLIWAGTKRIAVSSLADGLKYRDDSIAIQTEILTFLPGGRKAAIPVLLNALEDESPHIRWNAGYALREFKAQQGEVGPTLVKLLSHAKSGVRWNAAFILGELGASAEPAVPALVSVLEEKNSGDVLHDGGYKSAQRLYDLYKEQSVRSAAAEALGKIGPSAKRSLPALANALSDGSPFVRLEAAVAVRKIGGIDASTIPVLIGILTPQPGTLEPDSLSAAAAEELGEIGAGAASAVPALSRALTVGNGDARDQAARALGRIGLPAKAAVPELLKVLSDEAPFFRLKVAEALLKIDARLEEPVWALMDVLKDRSHPPFARELAIRALKLARPNSQAVVVALLDAKITGDYLVADLAAQVLASVAPEASRDSAKILQEALASNEPWIYVTAAEALWKSTGRADQAIPILVKGLGVQDVLARRWAARALGDAKPEHRDAVMPALRERLGDQDRQVRAFAAEAIWNIDGSGLIAVPALIDVLKDRSNPGRARERAAYALGRIGPAAKDATAALKAAAADESCWDVYVAARRALEKVVPPVVDGRGPAPASNHPVVSQDYPPR